VNGVGSSMSGGLPGYKPQHLLTGHNIADIVAMFDANLLKDINVIEIFGKRKLNFIKFCETKLNYVIISSATVY